MPALQKIIARLTLAAAVVTLGAVPAMAAGALVDSPIRGTYVYMTHRPSEDIAANLAMSRCLEKYGPGCHVLKVYAGGCLAIAQSSDGSHHSGWAVKNGLREANVLAIGQCAKYGGACHLDVSACE